MPWTKLIGIVLAVERGSQNLSTCSTVSHYYFLGAAASVPEISSRSGQSNVPSSSSASSCAHEAYQQCAKDNDE
eukprot:6469906-Amphidinium_carterae.3